jgi:WD40 repeat protein
MAAGFEQAHDKLPKAKIFISYSRKDVAFADRLDAALKVRGFEPMIDRTEIYALEDWWKRIEALIVQADTIVFVLSPDSAMSSICQKEVNFATSLNKRLAPAVFRPVDDKAVPEALARLNFIFFDDEARFDESIARLAEALDTDIDWVRKHTEFGEQSRRWAQAGRPGPRGLLLRPPVLDEAERWIAARPHNAPPPTSEMRNFIAQSRAAATRRQHLTIGGSLGVALIAGTLAIWATFERNRAVQNETRAVAGEQLAKDNEQQAQRERARAEDEEKRATEARDRALATQSRLLAERASRLTEQGDAQSAMLLSLEAFRSPDDIGPERYEPAAEKSLADALYVNALKSTLHAGNVKYASAAFSADGTMLIAVAADGKITFWSIDGETRIGEPRAIPADFGAIKAVIANPKRPILLFQAADGGYFAWNYETKQKLPRIAGTCTDGSPQLTFDPSGERLLAFCKSLRIYDLAAGIVVEKAGPFDRFALAGNGSRFVTLGSNLIQVWDATSGNLVKSWKVADSVQAAVMSYDGSSVLTQEYAGITIWDAKTSVAKPRLRTDQARTFDIYAHPAMPLFVTSGDEGVRIWSETSNSAIEDESGQFATFPGNGLVAFTTHDDIVIKRYLTEGHTGTYFGVEVATLHVAGGHEMQSTSADGKRVVTLTADGDLDLWITDPPMLLAAVDGNDKRLGSPIAPSGDGKTVATASPSGITLWKADTLTEIKTISFDAKEKEWKELSLDHDGKRLFYQDRTGKYDVIDVTSLKSLIPQQHPNIISSGDLAPDGAFAAVGIGNVMRFWSLTDLTERSCDTHREVVQVIYAGDERNVVVATTDGAVSLIDVQTCARKQVLSFPPVRDGEIGLTYRNGIVFAINEGRAQAWDQRSDKVLFDSRNEQPVSDIAKSQLTVLDVIAATRLVFVDDKFLHVFDILAREELLRFRIDINDCCDLSDLAVFPASDRILTEWSERGNYRMRLWRLLPTIDVVRSAAKTDVVKCLSPADRRGFGLPPEPPPWCIELGKWPYQTDDWKAWLKYRRTSLAPPLPDTPGWRAWVEAHPTP